MANYTIEKVNLDLVDYLYDICGEIGVKLKLETNYIPLGFMGYNVTNAELYSIEFNKLLFIQYMYNKRVRAYKQLQAMMDKTSQIQQEAMASNEVEQEHKSRFSPQDLSWGFNFLKRTK